MKTMIMVLAIVLMVVMVGCELQLNTGWSPNHTYSAGDAVADAGRSYISQKDNNRGNDPLYTQPEWWKDPNATYVTITVQ